MYIKQYKTNKKHKQKQNTNIIINVKQNVNKHVIILKT
jgi:hypothetical protein